MSQNREDFLTNVSANFNDFTVQQCQFKIRYQYKNTIAIYQDYDYLLSDEKF